jgi:hypothetical protein
MQPLFFRGHSIMLLRMVVQPAYEGIELQDDGSVSRYTYPLHQRSACPEIVLSAPELEAVQTLRRQWCHQLPTFRPLGQAEQPEDVWRL